MNSSEQYKKSIGYKNVTAKIYWYPTHTKLIIHFQWNFSNNYEISTKEKGAESKYNNPSLFVSTFLRCKTERNMWTYYINITLLFPYVNQTKTDTIGWFYFVHIENLFWFFSSGMTNLVSFVILYHIGITPK